MGFASSRHTFVAGKAPRDDMEIVLPATSFSSVKYCPGLYVLTYTNISHVNVSEKSPFSEAIGDVIISRQSRYVGGTLAVTQCHIWAENAQSFDPTM